MIPQPGTAPGRLRSGHRGPARDRLIAAFKARVAKGVLADGRGLKAYQGLVLQGFEASGVAATTSTWSWINSD